MSDAPRIVFFVPGLGVGGAERHTIALRAALATRGLPSALFSHGPAQSPILLAQPGAEQPLVFGLRGMSDLGGWMRVWRELRRVRPDVVIAVNQTPFIVTVALGLLLRPRPKVACVFHTTEMQSFESRLQKLFIGAARFADAMVFVGHNQRAHWEAQGLRTRLARVIENGVDLETFAPRPGERDAMRERLGFTREEIVFGQVGAFREEKNQAEFVAALASARAAGAIARGLFVGDGPTRAHVAQRAQDLGVADALVFAGETGDVIPFINACDVGVLSSTIETFPLCALEFLGCGVPMIAARVGGAPEIVTAANGRLYTSGDVPGFAAAIVALCDADTRARLAGAARSSVERFSHARMVDAYVDLIETLGDGRTPA